jgi:hypothetical protein
VLLTVTHEKTNAIAFAVAVIEGETVADARGARALDVATQAAGTPRPR